MFSDIMGLVDRFVNIFKKRLYGKTFFCPVCHLELSFHDTDENDCLVCPLCGVVIELHETYGHAVPIVNDVETNRVQPKARFHPLATHLPIGLFPIAFLGALFLLVVSVYKKSAGVAMTSSPMLVNVDKVCFLFLLIAVVASAFTFLTGIIDWKKRYGGRPYKVISLKIILSSLFLVTGLVSAVLHLIVFDAGFIDFNTFTNVVVAVLYFIFSGSALFMLATLGHVGGYLVFGK